MHAYAGDFAHEGGADITKVKGYNRKRTREKMFRLARIIQKTTIMGYTVAPTNLQLL